LLCVVSYQFFAYHFFDELLLHHFIMRPPFFHARAGLQALIVVVFCIANATLFILPCLAQNPEQSTGLHASEYASTPTQREAFPLTYPPPRTWSFRLSLFAGHDIAAIINQRFKASFGVCAGFQTATGVYLGAFASIHPSVIQSYSSPSASIAPIVIGGELGYEFVLAPTSFLRPTIGLGRFGVNGSYQGDRLAYVPEAESWVLKLGVTYNAEVSPDLLLGVELFALWNVGIRPAIHVGFRL
jgi:hypothetical protein